MRPLEGILLLDLTRVVSGPTCCYYLAALGADVVRIEPPGGDMTWQSPPFVGPDGEHSGRRGERDIPLSPLRRQRGKRSVVLDLQSPAGAATLRRLAARADALVENFRPGVMDDLGLGWSTLSELNERLVYCAITGYGPDGPYRDRPSMDIAIQAMSGLMAKTGFTDGPPTKVGAMIGDQVPGVFAALGVVAALRQRDLDGRGQHVDVSMLDGLLSLLWDEPLDRYEDDGWPERLGNGDPRGGPLDCFKTIDGWVALVVGTDGHWVKITRQMGRPELAAEFPTVRERAPAIDQLNAIVGEWASTMTSADFLAELGEAGIPAGPVNPPWMARTDPHVAHRGSLERLGHADLDAPSEYLGARLPIRFSRADTATSPAEPLGASTRAALADVLGLDDADLDALAADGAFGP